MRSPLILGIVLVGCGQPFTPQLFTETSVDDAGTAFDSANQVDAGVFRDAGRDTTVRLDATGMPACCGWSEHALCEQCPTATSDGKCITEGLRCLFHGGGFVEHKECRNGQWENGPPLDCS